MKQQDKSLPNTEARRSLWLGLAKELLTATTIRANAVFRLNPLKEINPEEEERFLDEQSDSQEMVSVLCRRLEELESDSPAIGAAALIDNPDTNIRIAICILVLIRLGCTFGQSFDTVGQITTHICGDDPSGALQLRNAFLEDGCLRRLLVAERRHSNIDHWRIALTESSLCTALGQTPDNEQVALSLYRNMPVRRI